MPTRTSGGTITFAPLPPPKRQQRFPNRRRTTRRSVPVPRLSKKQSTLTQLDFVSTPSSARDDVEDISSDEEFEAPQPKKKRRKSKFGERENDQSSLTQMVGRAATTKLNMDEDGFQIWRDDCGQDDVPEIPETSQIGIISSPRADSAVDMTVAKTKPKLQTPTRRRLKEIPSSQTPPSTTNSIQCSRRNFCIERSPLKERSTNVASPNAGHQAYRSPHTRSKRLEQSPVSTRKLPLNDLSATSQKRGARQAFSPNILPRSQKEQPRKLRRVNTVQDSQSDGIDLSHTTLVAESPVKPTPRFERTTTVQDSQFDEPIEYDTQPFDRAGQDYEQQTYGGYTQATFDPVSAALDRDAARFGWTQTQALIPLALDLQHEDSETDDEDLDRGCHLGTAPPVADLPQPKVVAAHPSAERLDDKAIEARSDTCCDGTIVSADAEEDTLDDPADVTLVPTESFPSSPPVLIRDVHNEPHQMTKEIPSSSPLPTLPPQADAAAPASSLQQIIPDDELDDEDVLQNTMFSEAPTIVPPGSPQHQSIGHLRHLETCSSLPLPPWSSPRQAQNTGAAERLHSDYQDWSLPPPPPMSSSRTQTTASSST